jgi:hypothetical protein
MIRKRFISDYLEKSLQAPHNGSSTIPLFKGGLRQSGIHVFGVLGKVSSIPNV